MYVYLLSASLLATFADSLFGPLYAVFVQGIGGDILDVGNSMALYSIMTGILIIIFGKISDKMNKEILVFLGFILSAFGTLGYLIIESPVQLYILQILFALSTSLISAPFSAIFAEHVNKKHSGIMWALDGGGGKVFHGIGLLIGTSITFAFGFTTTFVSICVLQICASLFILKVYMKTKKS